MVHAFHNVILLYHLDGLVDEVFMTVVDLSHQLPGPQGSEVPLVHAEHVLNGVVPVENLEGHVVMFDLLWFVRH